MNTEVQASVLAALSEYTSPTIFQPQKLVDINLADIVNDSLSLLEVVYDLEDRYDITLKPERLTELQTVADLVYAIDREVATSLRHS
jgi:acyl carrier protein